MVLKTGQLIGIKPFIVTICDKKKQLRAGCLQLFSFFQL
jgi:hypothetical protein